MSVNTKTKSARELAIEHFPKSEVHGHFQCSREKKTLIYNIIVKLFVKLAELEGEGADKIVVGFGRRCEAAEASVKGANHPAAEGAERRWPKPHAIFGSVFFFP